MNAVLNFQIPDKMHERIKLIAESQGRTISDVVREIIAKELNQRSSLEEMERRITELEKAIVGK